MKKLRIAIVCDSVTSYGGGSSVSTLRFSELLSKKGHHIVLFSSKSPKEKKIDFYKGIKVYRFPSFLMIKSRETVYFSLPFRKKIKMIFEKEKIDILHCMLPTFISAAAIKAARELGIPVVFHSHTQPESWIIYFPKFFQKESIVKIGYRYIISQYKKADLVICPTKFGERLIKHYGLKKRTEAISNGINLKKFKKIKNPNKYSAKFALSPESKKLLFVGRLDPDKNASLIIKAAPLIKKKFDNFEVCLVGEGNLKEDFKNLARKLGVEDKIKFLNRVSDEDLIKVYNISDIFILPSFTELEGLVVLEAMACGKPILISNSKISASKYFVNGNGFLFDPYKPEDLAEKCLKLLKNERLMKKMGEKSYKDAKEYNINKCVSKLEKVYLSLLKKSR